LVALIAAWLIASVYLVSWALNRGLTDDAGFSVYHLPGYLGLGALVLGVIFTIGRAVGRRQSWNAAFAGGLETVPVATGVLLLYVVADLFWREVVGIAEGIEGSLAPSRVLLPLGLGLLALTPLRVALAERATNPATAWAAALGIALAAGTAGMAMGAFHPVQVVWSAVAPDSRLDDAELWVMAADGSRQTRVIRAGGGLEVSLGAWAPDGTRVSYTRWEVDAAGSRGEIWTSAADGSEPFQVTFGSATDWIPDWSPDGAWIAYTAERERPVAELPEMGALPQPGRAPGAAAVRPDEEADLWIVRPDGTDARALTTMGGGEYLASWSPDGARVVFGNQHDFESGDLYIVDVATGTVSPLLERPGFDWAPSWSPDGSTIAFESDADGSFDIWTIGADGSGLRRLTTDSATENHPAWSPDGSRIAFVSDTTGDGEIWSMAADGSDLRNLTASPATADGYWGLDWAADGSILYASSGAIPASQDGLVRLDLAAAALLLRAAVLAVLALLLVSVGPPFGAFALLLGLDVAFGAGISAEWAFVPFAIGGGLLVDLAVQQSPGRWRTVVAAGGVAAVSVIAQAATLYALGRSGWSITLWLGTALAAGLFGAAVGWVVTTFAPRRAA
jgi:TolB protein